MWDEQDVGTTRLFREHDVVRTLADVIEEGQIVPAGSTGAVVYATGRSHQYMVESAEPFPCVATMMHPQLSLLLADERGTAVPAFEVREHGSVVAIKGVPYEEGLVFPALSCCAIVGESGAGGLF